MAALASTVSAAVCGAQSLAPLTSSPQTLHLSSRAQVTPLAAPSVSLRAVRRTPVAPRAAAETAVPPEVIATQKIRIKLRSYHVPQIEEASDMILKVAKDTGAEAMGPVRLPTHFRKFCVLRSPHVDKDSREHFEIRTHKRLIDLTSPTAQTIDALMQIEMPYGVAVDVKLT